MSAVSIEPGGIEIIPPMQITPAQTPFALMTIAVERGAQVDQLEKLMALHERWEAEQARKAFHAARARFQSLCPEIVKDKEGGGNSFKYKYASLPGIIRQVKQPLSECGLTFRWEIDDKGKEHQIEVSCILSHCDGHSEHNSMSAMPDDSGAKNDIQQRGSAVTYLQRYTLIGVLGIASANDDDDGKSAGVANVDSLRTHNEAVRDYFETIYAVKIAIRDGELDRAVEAWAEVDDETKRALWVAPTRGGIFSTSERAIMKSDAWSAARRSLMGGEQ
jgi:hypothetical protein